jgi:hypothetical protein
MDKLNRKLINYIRENNIDEVVKCLNDGANIHHHDDYALKMSAKNGFYVMTKLLLDYGANINAEFLLEKGADYTIDIPGFYILSCFIDDNADILRLLINYGFEFNKEYVFDQSLEEKSKNILELLLVEKELLDIPN